MKDSESLDSVVRDSLNAEVSRTTLSDDFTERVMGSLPKRSHRSSLIGRVSALVTGFLVLLIGVGIYIYADLPTAGTLPGAPETPAVPSDVTTRQFAAQGLSFDYPSDWTRVDSGERYHYETVVSFLGTGRVTQECDPNRISGAGCEERYDLAANSVVLRVSTMNGPPSEVDPVSDLLKSHAGARAITIDGRAGAVETLKAWEGSDSTVRWWLPMPGNDLGSYVLVALVRGPDQASIDEDLDALISTVRLTSVEQQ